MWPGETLNRVIVICAICLCLLIASVFLVELSKPVPQECSNQNWNAIYIGWDDSAGPCTYLQRVTSDLFFLTIVPAVIVWPLTLATLVTTIYTLISHKTIRWRSVRPFVMTWLLLLIPWSLFILVMIISG